MVVAQQSGCPTQVDREGGKVDRTSTQVDHEGSKDGREGNKVDRTPAQVDRKGQPYYTRVCLASQGDRDPDC